jgi:hypothetical protein
LLAARFLFISVECVIYRLPLTVIVRTLWLMKRRKIEELSVKVDELTVGVHEIGIKSGAFGGTDQPDGYRLTLSEFRGFH